MFTTSLHLFSSVGCSKFNCRKSVGLRVAPSNTQNTTVFELVVIASAMFNKTFFEWRDVVKHSFVDGEVPKQSGEVPKQSGD